MVEWSEHHKSVSATAEEGHVQFHTQSEIAVSWFISYSLWVQLAEVCNETTHLPHMISFSHWWKNVIRVHSWCTVCYVGLCFSLPCIETEYVTPRDLQDAANFLYRVQWDLSNASDMLQYIICGRSLVTSAWVFEHVFSMHAKYSKVAKIMKQGILCGFHSCAIQLRKWSGGLFKNFF